jgi:acetylglutamate kinase
LMYCFEKKGVLRDAENDNSVISEIDKKSFEAYVADGTIQGGMIPKLENAFQAIEAGVTKVVISKADEIGKNTGTIVK